VNEKVVACEPVASSVSPKMIAKIVMEVMARVPKCKPDIEKEIDPKSGFCLVKGNTVACKVFDTGNPQDKVGIEEYLTMKESPNMSPSFITMEKSSFDVHLGYEEIDYVVEGTLEFVVNGKRFTGHEGDVFYIPKDIDVTFSTPDKCKFFCVTYPANWQELLGK